MSSSRFQGVEGRRFAALLAAGVVLSALVIVFAFAADAEFGWPLLILLLICVVAAVGFRLIAGGNRDDADETDHLPRQPATQSRPLGDTPEVHDAISPHDLPPGSPMRRATERSAGGLSGTTRGVRERHAEG